jgi:F0F1-type ATP synthase assembly protein I
MAGGCRVFGCRLPVTGRRHEEKSRAGQDRRQGAVYQGAFEAVIALLVAGGIGAWLDGYFDTAPWLLLIGTAIGFASFTIRLIRLGRWMRGADSDKPNDIGESNNENEQ